MYNIFGDFTSILLIILFVVVFVKISNVKRRLDVLESKSFLKKSTPENTSIQAVVAPNLALQGNTSELPAAPLEDVVYGPTVGDKFVTWLKDDWMLKLGGFLLLIGLGWFTTYAFMNNWIGETGRITLGIIFGVLVLALGSWRIRKYINQGGIFLVIGSAIILLTVFAAREMYDMFTPLLALIMMFLSTAYISLISVKYNSFAVSLSGLVLAFIAPLLTNSSQVNEFGLFSYLFVVSLGAIWIVAIKNNWGVLIFASLIGVSFYSLPVVFDSHNGNENLIWFAYAFAALFFFASIINIISSKETDLKAFLWTAVGNGGFLLLWIMSFVSADWQSSIIAVWMFIFAVGAFISFSVTKIKSVFFVYAGVALAMLIVATSIELEGSSLVIAYALESFLVPILIYIATKDTKASVVASWLVIGPTLLSLGSLESYYRSQTVISKDFFVIVLVIFVLMSLGLIYKKIKQIDVKYNYYPDNFLLITGSVYLYTLIWAFLHVGITESVVATTLSLVIFIIIALIKYFYGIFIGSKTLRNYGAALIGFVILRLLFIDIWDMEMAAKIFVFVLIGILLMSTAFFSRRVGTGFIEDNNKKI